MNTKRKQVIKLIQQHIKNMKDIDDRLFRLIPEKYNTSLNEVQSYIKEYTRKIDNDKFIQDCINALGLKSLLEDLKISDWKTSKIIKMKTNMFNFDRYK